MSGKRFTIEVDENRDVRILDNGVDIGQYAVCKLLNDLYEENKFLDSYLEELEDSMFSDKDFSDYLQACHGGDVQNIKL